MPDGAEGPAAVLVEINTLCRGDTGQHPSVRPLRRSVYRQGLRSNCCRQMLCSLSRGRWVMKEAVGVAVQEEVTFVNMSRDGVNSEDASESFE